MYAGPLAAQTRRRGPRPTAPAAVEHDHVDGRVWWHALILAVPEPVASDQQRDLFAGLDREGQRVRRRGTGQVAKSVYAQQACCTPG
jgi:hypothetical protein